MTTQNIDLDVEPDDLGVEPNDDPLQGALDVEPEPAADVAGAVAASSAERGVLIGELLPPDFPLPTLLRYVPKIELKTALDQAVKWALGLEITGKGQGAIARGDAAVTAVRDAVKAIEADFAEPAALFDQAHKHVTKRRAEWIENGKLTITQVGRRVADETLRLDAEARKERDRQQAEANRLAREAAAKELEQASKADAPAAVIEELKEAAQTAVAPPVAAYNMPATAKKNSVTQTWKARIVGTPATAAPNPKMAELTQAQVAQVLLLLKGILDGQDPITAIELSWPVINGRAKDDKSTFVITGFEAFTETGLRSKPGVRR